VQPGRNWIIQGVLNLYALRNIMKSLNETEYLFRRQQFLSKSRNFQAFMEPEHSFLCSLQLAICSYPEPDKHNPCLPYHLFCFTKEALGCGSRNDRLQAVMQRKRSLHQGHIIYKPCSTSALHKTLSDIIIAVFSVKRSKR